uniref:Uncharacterized protein n=1 Tax=Nomascus leucogenys TaxID=61853 RepID=A0A2I3GXU9_NOMLE
LLKMAAAAAGDCDSREADAFSVEDPVQKVWGGGTAGGEDPDEGVKDNWDDDDDVKKEEAEVKPEVKSSEKKKTAEKIKEKERQQKKRQEEIKKRLKEPEEPNKVLTPEEQLADKLGLNKLQEESDLELAKETFGVNNTVYGIDMLSSKDDFTEFGKLLKDKITQNEKSLYDVLFFLEILVRDMCISLEIDDLKKITSSLTVLCSKNRSKKSQKEEERCGSWRGIKATMKDDLADYGGYDGGYVQDYEDFM